ncbi:MAG: hypothetical protein R3E89_02075 [Thiolinea sp.]
MAVARRAIRPRPKASAWRRCATTTVTTDKLRSRPRPLPEAMLKAVLKPAAGPASRA